MRHPVISREDTGYPGVLIVSYPYSFVQTESDDVEGNDDDLNSSYPKTTQSPTSIQEFNFFSQVEYCRTLIPTRIYTVI